MAATTTTPPRLARYRAHAANHTSGIYADMTVDGPEIGTLVVIIDRAKNLPNRRTMGKQDPYCAARLGKEAKKTETDRRGGQTPRWDQELRFIVHESPDYNKIKVSVFDDDKRKTNLIGETWVGLEDLFRPGGGQGDAWHTLNVKGKYAGEIRIELTYYDSRPKADKPRSRKQSNVNSLPSMDQKPAMLGPRQLTALRPLPPDPATAAASQFHDANSLDQQCADDNDDVDHQYNHNGAGSADGFARPLPNPRMSQSYPQSYGSPSSQQDSAELPGSEMYTNGYSELHNDYSSFSDDPYALEVVESRQGLQQDFQRRPQPSPPRHDRVQTLSGSPNPRPLPPIELLHSHSAPQLAPQERTPEPNAQFDGATQDYYRQYDEYGSSSPISNGPYDQHDTSSWNSPPQSPHDVRHDSFGDCYEVGPPPPPAHRNSAPAVPKAMPRAAPIQQRNTPTRALHLSTNVADFERSASEPPQTSSPHGRPYMPRNSYSPGSVPHLSPKADSTVRPRDEMAHDPRYQNSSNLYGPNANQAQARPSSYQESPAYGDYAPARPLSYHGDVRSSFQDRPPLIKPRAISPGRDGSWRPTPPSSQQYRTPRKSISSNPSPVNTQSSTPYSPDSFDSLNPTYSSQSTPDTGDKFEPTPMYSSPGSSPSKPSPLGSSASAADVPSPQLNARPLHHNGPILGSDGRIKDPSDHLPPSSYAPEPDRKGKRPSTVMNIKSRFGPRDARGIVCFPVSPASGPSPTDARQNRSSAVGGAASSPLSPTHSSILNSNINMNGGYNLSSPYPPPVPGKAPLGGYQRQVDEPDHFEMARLSLREQQEQEDDGGYEGSDFGGVGGVGSGGAKGRNLLGQVRARKTRWGA